MTRVQGLAEFERRWSAVPRLVRQHVRAALEDIAESIVNDMRRVAPKDTGAGAAFIGWTWGDAPDGAMVVGTVGQNAYASMRITIYAAADEQFYMRFQEFGTVNMRASPFFYPVWRARRRSARSRITRAINKAIRQA